MAISTLSGGMTFFFFHAWIIAGSALLAALRVLSRSPLFRPRFFLISVVPGCFSPGPPADPVAPAGDKNTLIASAMQYINGHLAEPLSLTKVAAVFSFSPAYFARAFRQAAGIPFTDYVARCRVNAVIAAISSRNINILDAAFQYGFRSSSGFYKTFTRVTGCPPGAFRRS